MYNIRIILHCAKITQLGQALWLPHPDQQLTMAKPALYHLPNEVIYDGDQVFNAEVFPPELIDRVREISMDQGDLLIATYPKSGTTWMQELAYLVFHSDNMDAAKTVPLALRSPFLELKIPGIGCGLDILQTQPHPWVMKSHFLARFLTKQLEANTNKIVVVMRNPKDTLVSYYHFHKNNPVFGPFQGTWDEFFELFKAKHLQHGDMFDWNVGWWAHRDNKNILYVKYEDMKKDIRSVIRQVALHCEKRLSEDVVDEIADRVSFVSMEKNPMVNVSRTPGASMDIKSYMRKGQVGDWKEYFTPEQNAYIDEKCASLYEPVGLHFDFE